MTRPGPAPRANTWCSTARTSPPPEGDPDPAIRDELSAHYSEEKANDIDLIVRAIMFGNLSGNTHDAFWARLAGRPAPGSRVGFEAAFALVTAPLFLLGRCRHRRERRALARATS